MRNMHVAGGFSVLLLCGLMLAGCGSKIPVNTVHSVDDLTGKTIGVQEGTTGNTLAGDIENAKVETYAKAADGIMALEQGKIDAVIVDMETANSFVETHPDITVLDEAFAEEEYAIAVNLHDKQLLDSINSALTQLEVDGTLGSIKKNYEGDEKGQHPYVIKEDADRSKGTLVMATNAEFPPYEERIGSEIVGFDVDMMNAVCDYLGYELQISDMAFEAVIDAVENGQADVGVAGLSVTDERKVHVNFSNIYATTNQVVIVRKK